MNAMRWCATLLAVTSLTASPATGSLIWDNENTPDSNTLLLYHLNGSGTTISDSSGNNLDGTLANSSARAGSAPAWLAAPAGDYLSQSGNPGDGMNGNVTVSGVDFDLGLSISFWYRARAGDTQSGELFHIEGPRVSLATDDFGGGNNGRLRLQAGGTNGDLVDFGATNAWRHVGVVYDPLDGSSANGGDWLFYMDNSLQDTVADATDLSSDTAFDFQLGDSTFNNAPLQGGDLDEALIQNGVITDFSDGYNSVIPEPASLVLVLGGGALALLARKRIRKPRSF